MTEPIVVPILLTLAGANMLAVQGLQIYRGLRSRHWPRVSGRITRLPKVRYAYEVDNRSYESTRLSFSTIAPSWDRLPSTLQPGQTVSVSYDPSNPSRAVLRPGVPIGQILYATPAVLIFAFGAWKLSGALR